MKRYVLRPRQKCALSLVLRIASAVLLMSLGQVTFAASAELAPSSSGTNKLTVSDTVAAQMETAALGRVLTNQLEEITRRTSTVENIFKSHQVVMGTFTALLILMLLLLRFGKKWMARIFGGSFAISRSADLAPETAQVLVGEEKAFAAFAATFRIGPRGIVGAAATKPEAPKTLSSPAKPATSRPEKPVSVADLASWAPGRIARLRSFLPELGRISGEAGRQRVIAEFSEHVQFLKEGSSNPDLLPFWQVTSSIEGILRQLATKPETVNASTLRTLAGSIDVLDRICDHGPNRELLKTPPVRFLVVDDDGICRHTVSFALKRALNAPDLAENGAAGLALAEANAYDAIFLDVQMPGMDGFELCKKIRATKLNRSTPVAFITCQSDFNSRTQSTLAGGCDLIGKPFNTFEVTAKALILALNYRLTGRETVGPAVKSSSSIKVSAQALGKACSTPTGAAA